MKTQNIIALLITAFFCYSTPKLIAQSSSLVWSSVPNFELLQLTKSQDGKLISSNSSIQDLITSHNILSIEQALPASRLPELQKVYELSCQCDNIDLLSDISKLPTLFQNPELGPEYTPLYEPNDYSIVYSTDYALDLINAQSAWDITTGDNSIIIAISDQNFYTQHEELVGKIHFYDTTNTAPKTHGTAVAITAAGNTDNTAGKSSIGFNSELALYRMSFNDILTATYSGSRVINVSWASGCTHSNYLQGVMDEVYANGSVVVCAAGNGGTCGGAGNLVYPAAYNNVISVTSVGPNDNHERYPGVVTSTHQHNNTVDISAPGYDIALSTTPGSYITGNGSSFAAPLVSGTIALMLSVDSCLTVDDIEYILAMTSVNIDSLNPGYEGLIGNGRLNAGAALEMTATYNACGIEDDDDELHEFEKEEDFGENDFYEISELTEHFEVNNNIESVGIESNETIEINIFPNPVKVDGVVHFQSDIEIVNYRILSIEGSVVMQGELNDDKIVINGMSSGTYLLHVELSNSEILIKRLVVQ